MKKFWPIVIAFSLVFLLVGFGSGFWYRQGEVDEAFTSGATYQQSITPVAITPASLLCSFSDGAQVLVIDADGGVDTEDTDTDTLTIENTDEERDATDLTLMMYNPITDKEGLHDNLETDSLEISITIGGVTSKLYHDGAYTDGVIIAGSDLTAGGEIAITVTWTAETCVAGTFQDAQNYTCGIYIYQPDANYVDTVAFTLAT